MLAAGGWHMVDDQWLGAELAGYRIEALIGRGGAGVVYRATHLRLHRQAAVKLLDANLAADAEYRRRFEREARLAAALEHPHIVPIYDAGYAEGVLYLAMRYIDGPDLATVIAKDGPMDAHRVCTLLAGVAEALDAAHHSGLVHRDVKPGNVLLTTPDQPAEREHAYLCDFGIARHSATSTMTSTGQFLGTLQYAAPEQIQGRPVDGRTDQYALACMVYRCLTGRKPYPADDPAAVMFAHISAAPPRPSEHNPAVPPAVDDVIARALAKSPADRFPDCSTFLSTLATAPDATAPAPPRPAPPSAPPTVIRPAIEPETELVSPAPSPAAGPNRRVQRALLLLGLPLVSLLVLAAMVWGRPSDGAVQTTPPPGPPSAPAMTIPPPTSTAATVPIGDPRLIDVCTFLDPAQFTGFGRVTDGPAIVVRFNRCGLAITLTTGGGAEVKVSVVELRTPPVAARAEQPGGLRIARPAPTQSGCTRTILLSDQAAVSITAQMLNGGSADPCALADLATEHAVRVLTERGVPHLPSPGGDANSLQRLEACALLDDQSLRRVPALNPARRHVGFANWNCQWGDDPLSDGFQPPAVDLMLQWVYPLNLEGEQRIRVANRDVYVGPRTDDRGRSACYAWIVHRDEPFSTGKPAHEIVMIAIYAATPGTEQCGLAQDFASAVISKLPPP
jgi:serine/threonine protein kinase